MPEFKAGPGEIPVSAEPTHSADIWEQAFATYMELLGSGDLNPGEAKRVMDEALAYIDRELEAQARMDREGG